MNKVKLIKLDFNQIAELLQNKQITDFDWAENGFDFNFFKEMGFEFKLKKTNIHSIYVVYCPVEKKAIGVVGFKNREDSELEIAYMIAESYRQKGYAKVAVAKALREIELEEVVNKIVAYVPREIKNHTILKENNFEISDEFEKYIEWQLLNGFY